MEEVVEALSRGQTVALVSDAGVPLVSDPGARVVASAIESGFRVESIPGPSAVLSALVVAGFGAARFCFLGFLPRAAGAREAILESYRGRPETLVMFESPARLRSRLLELGERFPERCACVARELTKRHEEVARGLAAGLAEHFETGVKGECTIVIEGATGAVAENEARAAASSGLLDGSELDAEIRASLAAGKRHREIVAELSSRTSLPRKRIYSRVQEIKDEAGV